jgi:uncharacterized protein (TIGR00299 family) protein
VTIAFVDVVGGAAGDMLLAALLDAGASRSAVADAVSSVLGRPVEPGTAKVRRGGLRGLALTALDPASTRHHRPLELLDAVGRAPLNESVRERATVVLERLLAAEARVHGRSLEELELEELGDDDTLLDVVGIAAALASLGVDRLLVSPLPMPPPSDAGEHGAPAPVTLELLRGFELRPSAAGLELFETITPTAAAVFAALGQPSSELPALALSMIGVGAGTRDPGSVPNVVRVLLGEPTADPGADRSLIAVEANVDDLSPELVPDAIDALLDAGALDAWAVPIVMKRGRPALTISALCEADALAEVRRAFFEATTTLGVRVHVVGRPELERRMVEVALEEGGPRIRVKLGYLDGRVITAKPEHADVVEAAAKLGRPVRAVHARASVLAQHLLETDGDGDVEGGA